LLDDLRERLRHTRWPDAAPGLPWGQGTDLAYLKDLVAYWIDGYDWRRQEEWLNSFAQFRAADGLHFVPVRRGGLPLPLLHGWPGTYVEMLGLVSRLPQFDLVIPSLPGYAFSPRPSQTGVTTRFVANRLRHLMTELGYRQYAAGGTDFGSAIATHLALLAPQELFGIHLTNLDIHPQGLDGPTEAETAYLATNAAWNAVERGYSAIQSSKPQTLGYGLMDSP